MSSALAAVGRIRKRLGVDEGERCNSRNTVQPHLSCVQGMEELDSRGQFCDRMDLVRQMMILTIEQDWLIGCGPGGSPYGKYADDFWVEQMA